MKDFTLENLTEAVVEAYTTNAASPRQAEILGSLIKHLHEFAKDVELTEQEWFEGQSQVRDPGGAVPVFRGLPGQRADPLRRRGPGPGRGHLCQRRCVSRPRAFESRGGR